MVTFTIDRLGHLGEGIAEGPIYVPRVLPGEVVEGAVEGGRLPKPRILTPSPDRVKPPCPHYKACGGCGLMHGSESFVAGWKRSVVEVALNAHRIEAEVEGPLTSPAGARRRAVISGRRLKSGPVVGFHAPGSDTVTGISGCHLLAPALLEALPAAEELTAHLGSRKGEVRIMLTATETGVDVALSGTRALAGPDYTDLAALAERHDLARLTVEAETIVVRRAPVLRLGDFPVFPPPGTFLQATLEGETALRMAVSDAIAGADHIVDLFAGLGTFALPLAATSAIHAVEAERPMLEALTAAWRKASGLKAVKTEARDLFRRPLMPDELRRFEAAVIDPPRAGAEAQVAELAKSDIARIASVSCNPVTFSRDAKTLIQAGFRMGPVQLVDQFRWSPHIELVAAFSR